MSQFFSDSIFWVEIEKVRPNPFQPRKEFEESKLKDLAESIRQYGILQPLVVTRKEIVKDPNPADGQAGGLTTEYELISGERRLRASKIAGLSQVPVLIRDQEESDQLKLELAIIENLQREDLNAVDRAKAFQQLVEQFHFKHSDVAKRVGKSREYVSNSLRILLLPPAMLQALSEGKITEGHTRPLLMLEDRPAEQEVLFKEMLFRKMSVREAELNARKIAVERARKPERIPDPEITELEEKLAQTLGARVHIEKGIKGGKITIDFFSTDDLHSILEAVNSKQELGTNALLNREIKKAEDKITEAGPLLDDRSVTEKAEDEQDLYSVDNFTV